MSFYRTYRPQTIAELDTLVARNLLSSLASRKREDLPHAFLLSGPKGIGKTTTARLIAKLFCCQKPSSSEGPCGACEACASIAAGKNLDVTELDAASNRGIEEVRALRESVSTAPIGGDYKIYIIDEAHMMTNEAFNALLKTLEEPPSHVIFVLATTDLQKIPETIKSRCQLVQFARATAKELISALVTIVKKEKLKVPQDVLELIVEQADGSFRDAVKYLEQVSLGKSEISLESAAQLLSLTHKHQVREFVALLSGSDTAAAVKFVDSIIQNGTQPKGFITDVLKELHLRLVASFSGSQTDMPLSRDRILTAIDQLTHAYSQLRHSPLPQLPLETAVVRIMDWVSPQTRTAILPDHNPQIPPAQSPPAAVIKTHSAAAASNQSIASSPVTTPKLAQGLISLDALVRHWPDIILAVKRRNNSLSGFLRSSRPIRVADGIVTIEAFYQLHKEKLAELSSIEVLSKVLKELFGELVKIEIVLGKK